MLTFPLINATINIKMVKSKRDLLKSPRRRSLTIARCGLRPKASLNSGADICVVVRVRPPNGNEQGENRRKIVKVVSEDLLIFDPKEDNEPFFYHGVQQKGRDLLKKTNKNLSFRFDNVFGFDSSNKEVFEKSTKSLISTLMDGYNCSVFVYGATGAGKTFTMIGKPDNPGITVLTMSELFRRKEELSQERDFELGITYLEVYNENVQDLLNPGSPLHLREDGKFGVIVSGIQIKRIENSEELFELLDKGNKNRTQHPTDANAESSRSHAVFQVYLKMTIKTTQEVRVAKLSMIDLAGSERGSATGYTGARFTEGANINKSLLALGNCINSLADGHRHIPYRDSKLTRLLKDSLGGNCKTVMIANISPSSLNFEDTYNTLKYATRAKKIKSKLKKNVVTCNTNIQFYIKQNEELRKENERIKLEINQLKSQTVQPVTCTCTKEDKKDLTFTKLEKAIQTDEKIEENEDKTNRKETTKIKDQLAHLFARRQILEEQIACENTSKNLFIVRKDIKEFADSRLSGLCTEQNEKIDGHKKLGNKMENLQKQTERFEKYLKILEQQVQEVEQEIQSLEAVNSSQELTEHLELLRSRIDKIKIKAETDFYKKKCEILSGELRMSGDLITQMSNVLKPCFLQLRGHGVATPEMITDYHNLVRQFQGYKTVSWKEEDVPMVDSGVSSTTTIVSDDLEENVKKVSFKRKFHENKEDDLNETFVIPLSSDPKPTEIVLTRVTKPPVTKKVATVQPPKLIRLTKENRDPTVGKRIIGMSNKSSQAKSPSQMLIRKCGENALSTPKPTLKSRR